METVGIASSIIAVIQLSGKVASLGYGYIGAVKRAPTDVQELVDELVSLSRVLIALRQFSDNNPQSEILHDLKGLLEGCSLELERLEDKLKPLGSGWRKILGSLKWPLKEAETSQTLARIVRHKDLFMDALNTYHITLTRAIGGEVEELRKESQAEYENQKAIRIEAKRMTVLNWLYTGSLASDAKHTEISNKRQKNTGQWFLNSPEFQEWASGLQASRILWGYGIPGAGKTFLSSLVVDHFNTKAQTLNYGVARIYFDYKEKGQQGPLLIISNLVRQLASQIPKIPTGIEILYDKLEREGGSPTLEDLYTILLLVFRAFSKVFLIFDALDECERTQRDELLPLFHQMKRDACLFVTSREYPEDIQESFRFVKKIRILAKDEDIRCYIEERIQRSPRARRLVQQAKCKDKIISELISCAQGMFLLARFHMEYLCQQPTAKHILKAIENVKNSSAKEKPLYPIYDRIIGNVMQQPENCAELAIRTLSWLVKAKNTLTVTQIQTAVSVEVGRYELDELDLPDRATLLDVCGGLVTIEESSDIIRLAHFTVQEYLLENTIIPTDIDFRLAKTCTTYLSFDIFTGGACTSNVTLDARLDSYPFFEYTANYMPAHVKSCSEDLSKDGVLKFLGRPGNVCSWVQANTYLLNKKGPGSSYLVNYTREEIPLIAASSIGHCMVVQQLLDEGADVTALDRITGTTALSRAALQGHEEVVKILLNKGADVSKQDMFGRTALHKAAWIGHEGTVRLLLENGAAVTVLNNRGQTALHNAVYEGREGVVRLLLENNAGVVSISDRAGRTALHEAALQGNLVIAKFLLENGANALLHWQDMQGWTALNLAAFKGHEAMAQLLIEIDANINVSIRNIDGNTPLHNAALKGHEFIFQLLIDNGANFSTPNLLRETALHHAANQGHDSIVRLLLKKGAKTLVRDVDGRTPLLNAASKGHKSVVKSLLESGANVSIPDMLHRRSPLSYAASNGHEAVVRLLLEHGADVSAPDAMHLRSPLSYAAANGHEPIVRLLLEYGANVSQRDALGRIVIDNAEVQGHDAVVKILLEVYKEEEFYDQLQEDDFELYDGGGQYCC